MDSNGDGTGSGRLEQGPVHANEKPEQPAKGLEEQNGRPAEATDTINDEEYTHSCITKAAAEEWRQELPFWSSWLDFVEDGRDYARGGYHFVNLEDVLDGKYEIVHKLGHGGFATVWLARVLNEARYVAIKILVARAPTNTRELEFFAYLKNHGLKHPSFLTPLDVFTVSGQNGVHRCFVLDFVGPPLSQVRLYDRRRSILPSMARNYARQLGEGLAYLHSIGVCHGDLTSDNVLLEVENINTWTKEEIYKRFGKPRVDVVELKSGRTFTVVEAIRYKDLEKLGLKLTGRLFITDFAEWFPKDNPPSKEPAIPLEYRAPELIFGQRVSEASDVWALGCLIYELRTYDAIVSMFFATKQVALLGLVSTLGPLPSAWLDSYPDKKVLIDETDYDDPLAAVLMQTVAEPEYDSFLALLKAALQYDPTHRMSAKQLLEQRWFTDTSEYPGLGDQSWRYKTIAVGPAEFARYLATLRDEKHTVE